MKSLLELLAIRLVVFILYLIGFLFVEMWDVYEDYKIFNTSVDARITYNIFKEMETLASAYPEQYFIHTGRYLFKFGKIESGKSRNAAYGFKTFFDYAEYQHHIIDKDKLKETREELDVLSELGDILRQGKRQVEQEANQTAEQIIKDYLSRTDK